ncbi:hypothetical protein KAI87_05540 [Myxococcota bacterium]|nr:hypothetical protein [Myxococcota bacterium]
MAGRVARLLTALTLMFSLGLFASGCSTEVDMTDVPLFDNGTNVFEAQVINGQTGERVDDATIQIQIGHHILKAEVNDGFYTIYGIPAGTFIVTVTVAGYTNFRALLRFNQGGTLSGGSALAYLFKNIVMYPVGVVPGDITVRLFDGADGAPVVDAIVVASLTGFTNYVTADEVLTNNADLLPSTVPTTSDAEGLATLASTDLIMGGAYSIDVFGALDANGVFMVPAVNQIVTVGTNLQELVIFLDRPSLDPVALMVNNEDDAILSTLVVTFPYAVELCTQSDDHDWSNVTNNKAPYWSNDSDGDGNGTTVAADDPVTVTLSENDTILTAEFVANENDAGDELWVEFSGIEVKPMGSSDGGCVELEDIEIRNTGSNIDTQIHVREIPQP